MARLFLGGAEDAKLLDTPMSFINTASKEGAATSGSLTGVLFKCARKEWSRVKSSAEGTGEMAANEECMPLGGNNVV